ncbi:MAG: hypothetical protein AAFW66_05750 [Pseudomonadota bacterium]
MLNGDNGIALTGVAAALIGWGVVSYTVLGPLAMHRTVDLKTNWAQSCSSEIRRDIALNERPAPPKINMNCQTLIGWMPDGDAVCRKHGNPLFNIPGAEIYEQQRRVLEKRRQARIALAANKAGSRCSCAVSVASARNAKDWALYAGSFRVLTGPAVTGVRSTLVQALNSPDCSMKG